MGTLRQRERETFILSFFLNLIWLFNTSKRAEGYYLYPNNSLVIGIN